ncbi:Atxe2 family lasso peptide isopeptidase [Sphingomonas sp. CJ99]
MRRVLPLLLALAAGTTATAGPTLRETIELADLSSIAASPDGKHVVYRQESGSIERNGHALDWFVVPVDGSLPPRRIGGAGDGGWLNGTLLTEPPLWSTDSRWILYRATIDGETQLWRASVDGERAERVTSEPGDVADLLQLDGAFARFRVKPDRAAIERAEAAARDKGVRIDATIDPSRPLLRGGLIDGRRASERLHGRWFGSAGLLGDQPPVAKRLDLRDFSIHAGTASPPPAPLPDGVKGREIMRSVDFGDPRGVVHLLYRNGVVEPVLARRGRAIACPDPACQGRRILHAAWIPGSNALLLADSLETGGTILLRWDIGLGRVTRIAETIDTLNGGRDRSQGCAVTAAAAICVAANANHPPRLVAIDLADGRMRTLAGPNAGIAERITLRFEPVEWQDRQARRFTGQLLRPLGPARPAPLFITYYSCPGFIRGGLGDEFPLRQLAEHGIAALCINRYPAQDGEAANREAYAIAASGIEAIIDRLAREGAIDPSRVGMGGVSFGGEVAAWIAIHSPDRLAALSIANVMPTPTYYWQNAVEGRDVPAMLLSEWGLGEPSPADPAWRQLSPAYNTDRIRTPFLMQLPEQEYRPNIELLARLQRAGTPAELWAFADEAHIKWQPRHRLAANQRNLDWFRFWLAGSVDDNPAKAAQYRRWCRWASAPSTSCTQFLVDSQPLAQASASIRGSSRNMRSSAGKAPPQR